MFVCFSFMEALQLRKSFGALAAALAMCAALIPSWLPHPLLPLLSQFGACQSSLTDYFRNLQPFPGYSSLRVF